MTRSIAYFITPHGFGHAARACAVMSAWQAIAPATQFEIYTRVPLWFFRDSFIKNFNYHALLADIGLVQTSPLHADLKATLQSLNGFIPFAPDWVSQIAQQIKKSHCERVLCDIAPLGIAVAREAGIPAVLIENFTWDWIYANYLGQFPQFGKHIDFLRGVIKQVDYHIQTQPACCSAPVDLITRPVCRPGRLSREEVRKQLNLPQEAPVVLISMGGIPPQHYLFLERIAQQEKIYFVIPGASQRRQRQANLVFLPYHSGFYHPDLIHASDMVLGKLGYSTVAEAYWAGISFGYITRACFRESEVLAHFVEQEMNGFAMDEAYFQTGTWVSKLPEYLNLPPISRSGPNGAEQIARFMVSLSP